MIIRRYREGDEIQIAELLRLCFSDFNRWGVTAKDWLSYELWDYGIKRENALVAEVDGRVVGHLHLVLRRVYIGRSLVDLCGIANVSTHPEFRGRGVATALVSKAPEICKDMGTQVVSLLTGYASEGHRVYRKVGFTNTTILNTYVGLRTDVEKLLEGRRSSGLEVEELREEVLDEVAGVHENWGRKVNLTVWRPRDYWVNKILNRFFFYSFFYDKPDGAVRLVFRDSSKLVGYSLSFRGPLAVRPYFPGEMGVVFEVASVNEAYLEDILVETLRHLLVEGVKIFRLHLPPNAAKSLRYFEEFRGALLMDYVVDLKGFLRVVTPELTVRASSVRYRTTVAISSPFGYACLDVSDSGVDIVENCRGGEVVELDSDGVVKLLYGVNPLEELVDLGYVRKISLSSKSIDTLRRLFPKRLLYIPRIDQW